MLRLPPALYTALVNMAKSLRVYDALFANMALRRFAQRLVEPPPHPLLAVLERLQPVATLHPPALMDVGARGGIQPPWKPIARWLEVIGFEPDSTECERLNAHFRLMGERVRVYPVALADSEGEKPYFVAGLPNSSGIFAADPAFHERLQDVHTQNLKVRAQETLHTRTIDAFLSDHSDLRVDFIKIDVEGAEYEVLAGAKDLLAKGEILGVEYEVWVGPIKGRPDRQGLIDTLLRESGLHLFDLSMRRYTRGTFPHGFIPDPTDLRKFSHWRAVNERYGQHITGDALYLRDPVWEHKKGTAGFAWNDEMVLRMALIYSIYNLPDCAIELVQHYARNFSSHLPFELIYDALTPPGPRGRRMRYREYLAETKRRSHRGA